MSEPHPGALSHDAPAVVVVTKDRRKWLVTCIDHGRVCRGHTTEAYAVECAEIHAGRRPARTARP
ncbi:MAG TPA: hypothetical protein VF288_10715 [Mycobacteriales bacterium]